VSGLWDWAVQAYARPGVAETCLELQDGHGQNVPYLLWGAWAAGSGRVLDADDLEAGVDTARAWDEGAVRPLRTLRRGLKAPIPDMDDAAREGVREQIKAAELAAERALLEGLEPLAPGPAGPPRPLAPALVEAAKAWTRVVPRAHLERLAAQLSG
jgi:uncharacterized protein (TIGR02444 family)